MLGNGFIALSLHGARVNSFMSVIYSAIVREIKNGWAGIAGFSFVKFVMSGIGIGVGSW